MPDCTGVVLLYDYEQVLLDLQATWNLRKKFRFIEQQTTMAYNGRTRLGQLIFANLMRM